jgi:V8-like Glu-specific endopeptidase
MENGLGAEKMVMRTLRLLAIVAIVLATAAPAAAILKGTPDTEHSYVGILVTRIDGELTPVCSGFLVTQTAFVTAAHCIDDLGDLPAYVSFDQGFTDSSPLVHGTAIPNPDFTGSMEGDTHDVALVALDSPVTGRGHAELPALGTAASAKKDVARIVGYGATGFLRGGGKPVPDFQLVRTSDEIRIAKLDKGAFNLRTSSGICFGDSGGPTLLGDTDVALAINSQIKNDRCKGGALAYRLDTAESLAFLEPYVS